MHIDSMLQVNTGCELLDQRTHVTVFYFVCYFVCVYLVEGALLMRVHQVLICQIEIAWGLG